MFLKWLEMLSSFYKEFYASTILAMKDASKKTEMYIVSFTVFVLLNV